MAKASNEIIKRCRDVDVVVQVKDARIPASSVNSNILQLLKGKPWVDVYNKVDLSERRVLKEWIKTNKSEGCLTNANATRGMRAILESIQRVTAHDRQRYPDVTVMVVGMPNVGKSSIINAMRRYGVGKGMLCRMR
jgi:hypothetical protein